MNESVAIQDPLQETRSTQVFPSHEVEIEVDNPCEHTNIPSSLIEDFTFSEDEAEDTLRVPDFSADDDKLFPGAKVSTLQAVTMLVSWFSMFPGISKEAFNKLLYLLHTFVLPDGNLLPSSYYHAIKKIKPYLSPVKEYHCCTNDCVIYRDSQNGNFEQLTRCPVCGEDRFCENGKPRKVFKYMSIITRIKRLFSDATTSELLQGHFNPSTPSRSAVANIHESNAWHDWYKEDGLFHGDTRSICFAFCTDGLNPFAQHKNNYSMWPMFLIPLNLPQHIRSKSGAMMLTGIIPGPHEPGNIQPYLDLVVDDLTRLNEIKVYDAFRKEEFKIQASIQLFVCDYPGQNKVFETQGI